MDQFLHYYFNFDYMVQSLPALSWGLLLTLALAVTTIIIGIPLGLLLAVLRATQIRLLSIPIIIFADVFRALPPLVVLIFMYFGLPYAGINIGPFFCAALTLGLVLAALAEEIFWAGIVAVQKGQWDAARSTGMTFFQTLLIVIVPQGVRLVIPPLTNKIISITKMTSLASVVAVPELLNQAVTEQGVYANPTPLTLAALMFVAIFLPLVRFSTYLERRYGTIG
jgi:cystine transport system permease protein